MKNPNIDVLFVGNAIMDVLSSCEESFLTEHCIEKGGMNLIDEERALYLYSNMPEKLNNLAARLLTALMDSPVWVAKPAFQARLQLMLSVTALSAT